MWDSNTNSKLQIGANIAILLGLVMVAFQINQANQISSAEFFDQGITADAERQLALLGENPNESMYRLLHEPDTATPQDYYIADRVYDTLTSQVQRSITLEQADLYLGNVRGLVRANYELFACPYGVAYLEQLINRIENNEANRSLTPNQDDDQVNVINAEFLTAMKRLRELAGNAYNRGEFSRRVENTKRLIENGIPRVERRRPQPENN